MRHHIKTILGMTLVVAWAATATAATVVVPGGARPEAAPRPGGLAQPTLNPAPTVNLARVASALTLRSKSLTTLVGVAPGLALTKPVTISIGYYSPAGNNRITQTYSAATGSHFLYSDNEGDGKPRQMRIDITLSEPNPAGPPYTHALLWQANLDPLYDVSVSPFQFGLINQCDRLGQTNEIAFQWRSPDGQFHKLNFNAYISNLVGDAPIWKAISQFAWARTEVSASHNLRTPGWNFGDDDGLAYAFLSFEGFTATTSSEILVPGKTRVVKGIEKAWNGSCKAQYQYTITYKLRQYPYL